MFVLYRADLGSGIPAWLTSLMGSDICLGVCFLKVLCRGNGVTGLSLGLWDDSTCFAHQLPKPVCCTVMLPHLGCWGWSSNPVELATAALPKAPNQAVGAALATSLEHPTGLSCPLGYLGYTLQPFTEVICFLSSPFLALTVVLILGLI